MHELSIALEVCRIAEQHAGPMSADRIVEVGVELGDDSGFDAANLEFCLESLLAQPPFQSPQLVIGRVAGDTLRLSYLEIDDGSSSN